MVTTQADLNRRVAELLHESLHGRTVDMMQSVEAQLPHMLGYTPIGEEVAPADMDGTLLDADHDFWDAYANDITENADAQHEVITAVNILEEKGLLWISYPFGEEHGTAYIEVQTPTAGADGDRDTDESLTTTCVKCGTAIDTAPALTTTGEMYLLVVPIDCPSCSFSRTLSLS